MSNSKKVYTSLPQDREPPLRLDPLPPDTNHAGDVFGGWIMSQVDIAGSLLAIRRACGRVATVAVNNFVFKHLDQPLIDFVLVRDEIPRRPKAQVFLHVGYLRDMLKAVACVDVVCQDKGEPCSVRPGMDDYQFAVVLLDAVDE